MSDNVRKIDFWFRKIHLTKDMFFTSGIEVVIDELEAAVGTPIQHKRKTWHLGGLKRETIDSREILWGKIGSESTSGKKTVYDGERKDFVDLQSEETNANYIYFLIDIKNYIIAIEAQIVSIKTILKMLLEFLSSGTRSRISTSDMRDKFDVYSEVRSWDKVNYAFFDLVPTNPSSDPEFDELDKIIQKTGGTEAKLAFIAEGPKSLQTDNDSYVMKGIAMSSAGYGTFKITGVEKNGGVGKILSKEKKLRKSFKTDGTDIESKIVDFIDKFKKGIKDEK